MNDERLAEMFKESQEICSGLEIENKEIRERNVMYLNKLKSFSQELLAERAKVAELQKEIDKITILRPIKNIHEDYGDVLLWNEPIGEPPDVGSCIDCNFDENKYTHFSLLPNIK